MLQRTLFVLKPDAVERNLIGVIIARFERAGLKVVAAELRTVPRDLILKHYAATEMWLKAVGEKTLEGHAEFGLDAMDLLGTSNPTEIGHIVRGWLADYMTSGPVLSVVLEGNRAVANCRRLVGNTMPSSAAPGTIRGDFSVDSPDAANAAQRPVRNLVHASGTLEEANAEIELWFPEL